MKDVLRLKMIGAMILYFSVLRLAVAQDNPATLDRPVEAELTAMAKGFEQRAPDKAKIFAEGIAAVAASGIVEMAPKVGDKVELFELPDASGKMVRLADLLARGPVVLTWYRGGWCPYCNIGLRGLLKSEPRIRELGATLVAITPETPDNAAETIKTNALTFAVLSDRGNGTARKFKIVFKLPAQASATMKAFKLDLEKRNGDTSDELPLSVTYVIDRGGTIRWAFVDADYRKRAEPADVIAALERLTK
jgi:peroxiredoxin